LESPDDSKWNIAWPFVYTIWQCTPFTTQKASA